MIGIYKATNLINGKSYIGLSTDLSRRKREHLSRYKLVESSEYDSVFHRAIRKYGEENFQWEILELCDISDLNDREIYWIAFYHTYIRDKECNGYNVTPGGTVRATESSLPINDIIYNLQHTLLSLNEIAQKFNTSANTISSINLGHSWFDPELCYPLRQNKKIFYCVDCGKKLKYHSARCKLCLLLYQSKVIELPTREELKQLIRTLPFTTIGKMYNVSDNAVRKWCHKYNLPYTKKSILAYDDKSWMQI